MRRSRFVAPLSVALASALTVACSAEDADLGARSPADGGPSAVAPDAQAAPTDAGAGGPDCLADLAALGIAFVPATARGVVSAVKVTGKINDVEFTAGTKATPLEDPIACEFVKTLHALAGVAKAHGFVRIGTLGSYCYRCCCQWTQTNQCRKLDDPEPDCGSSGYSNHSFGRAVDIRYLAKADGTTYDVNNDAHFKKFTSTDTCGAGLAAQTGVSRALYAFVCELAQKRLFKTLLTPNYNAAHRDHFHFDTGESGSFTTVTVKSWLTPIVDAPVGPHDACGAP